MTFRRIVLPLSSQCKNEFIPKEAGFSKTLAHFYQATWSHIPEKCSQSLLWQSVFHNCNHVMNVTT
jgi:hypothetical protein